MWFGGAWSWGRISVGAYATLNFAQLLCNYPHGLAEPPKAESYCQWSSSQTTYGVVRDSVLLPSVLRDSIPLQSLPLTRDPFDARELLNGPRGIKMARAKSVQK
jgi:hypothetical protein